MDTKNVFVSWSSGKDSYLALLKGRDEGLNIKRLLTFMGVNGYSRSHGVKKELLEKQADCMGVELELEEVTWPGYEEGFIKVSERLKEKGIGGGVFGDINLEGHRQWVEDMCRRCGLVPYLPLWGMTEEEVLLELLHRGVKLLIVSLRTDLIEENWLGKRVDMSFYNMCLQKGLSPCGENGEYHTLVVNGPLFKHPLEYSTAGIMQEKERAFLQINV